MDDEAAEAVLGPPEKRPMPTLGLTPIFADSFTVLTGPEIVRLQFGDVSPDSRSLGPLLADVVMSRSRAERLVRMMGDQLALFEAREDAAGVARPFEPPADPT